MPMFATPVVVRSKDHSVSAKSDKESELVKTSTSGNLRMNGNGFFIHAVSTSETKISNPIFVNK